MTTTGSDDCRACNWAGAIRMASMLMETSRKKAAGGIA
jgi:hypothetical protein